MRPSRCLADFVAPKDSGSRLRRPVRRHGRPGREKKEQEFLARTTTTRHHVKALADRLAEAFAECLHQRVRTDLWGYARDEQPTTRR
jgi:5-methyltetrahydrofolate--homocysteine methyltransferase